MIYAVIDGSHAPKYTIAPVGGTGHAWVNVPRANLVLTEPQQLYRKHTEDGDPYYTSPD